MKICGKRNGFTLVELMIAMVSSAFLALIVGLILFMTYRSWRTDNEYARLRRDTAFAMQLISKEIRSSTFSGLSTNSTRLTLSTNAVRPNVTRFDRSADTLTYSINGVSQGPLITKGVSVFTPQLNPSNQSVLVKLVLVNTDGSIAITNQTFIYPRN